MDLKKQFALDVAAAAAEALGLEDVRVSFYAPGSGLHSARGFVRAGDPNTVHIREDLPFEEVPWILPHEIRHVFQARHMGCTAEAYAADKYRFEKDADDFTLRLLPMLPALLGEKKAKTYARAIREATDLLDAEGAFDGLTLDGVDDEALLEQARTVSLAALKGQRLTRAEAREVLREAAIGLVTARLQASAARSFRANVPATPVPGPAAWRGGGTPRRPSPTGRAIKAAIPNEFQQWAAEQERLARRNR